MAQDLKVEVREETGRSKVKRLRAAGKIPAVIYGSGEDTVSLSLPSDEFNKIINRGERIVSLSGGVASDAYIKEVQWDIFGNQVLHVDLTRVAAGVLIDTTVKLELRGVAPGTKMGGQVETSITTLDLRCPPRSITDKVEVNINELELDQSITIGQLPLPEGSECALDPDTVVVQCVTKKDETEGDDTGGSDLGPVEPEVIGKKDEEGGDAS